MSRYDAIHGTLSDRARIAPQQIVRTRTIYLVVCGQLAAWWLHNKTHNLYIIAIDGIDHPAEGENFLSTVVFRQFG